MHVADGVAPAGRRALGCAAAALAVAVVVSFTESGAEPGVHAGPSARTAERVDDPAVGDLMGLEPPLSEERAEAALPSDGPAGQQERLFEGAWIRLVLPGSAGPASCAVVRVSPGNDAQWTPEMVSEWNRASADAELRLKQFGRTFTAGSDGRVRVPRQEDLHLAARLGDFYGEALLDTAGQPPAGGWEIQLEADRSATIRVLGPGAEPLEGVPVVASFTSTTPSGASYLRQVPLGRSRADGLLRVPHVQRWSVAQASDGQQRIGWRAVHPGGRAQAFSLLPLGTQEVELRCTQVGSVSVRRRDGAGRSVDSGIVRLVELRPDGTEGTPCAPLPTSGASRRFPAVAAGRRYRVTSWSAGEALALEFEGPTVGALDVSLELLPGAEQPFATVRLETESGEPISGQGVQVSLVEQGERWEFDLISGDGGELSIPLDAWDGERIELEVVCRDGATGGHLRAELLLHASAFPAGRHELGTARLRRD